MTLCACRDLLGCERGAWCGSCLWTRMGQNIHEVSEDPAWRCPPCLDLCNCSGLGCTRCRAGWAPTGILNKEHHDAGFKSVRPKFHPKALDCTRCRAGWAPTGILNKEHQDASFKSVP